MRSTLVAGVTALSLVAMPVRAWAGPARDGSAAQLQVDTSELGGIGPVLKERLVERGSQVFRDEDITAGGPDDPVVLVTVRELEGEDPGFEYEIRLEAASNDDDAAWRETCELCTEAELIDTVASELDKVAVALRALERATPAEEPPPPVVEAPPPQPEETPTPSVPDRRIDTKGKVGIGLLALGVVAAGTGVGLVLAPARPLPDDPLRERYTQPPGYAALAVGGVALVTGGVLLGLSLRDRKRATARHPARYFALRWGSGRS